MVLMSTYTPVQTLGEGEVSSKAKFVAPCSLCELNKVRRKMSETELSSEIFFAKSPLK